MTRGVLVLAALQIVFSTRTEVVSVPVTVFDATGRRVSGLTRDDFHVYDNGRPVPIVAFETGETPITLGLVVDYSLSMRPKLPALVKAIDTLAASSRPGDEMYVLRFNDQIMLDVTEQQPFWSDSQRLAAVVAQGTPGGGTALYDSVIAALRHLRLGTRDHKALIVVSDGSDNSSGQTLADVVRSAQQSEAVIYVIGIVDADDRRRDTNALKQLAQRSGGEASFPKSVTGVAEVLARVAADLREQYTLGFAPNGPDANGRARRIEVKLSAKHSGKLRVRARSSYVPG